MSDANGAGSMTLLPIVETQEGDVTGLVCSNLISMTDGQLYLNTNLFNQGFRPAIDLGLSVSRIGSKVQYKVIKEVSKTLKICPRCGLPYSYIERYKSGNRYYVKAIHYYYFNGKRKKRA